MDFKQYFKSLSISEREELANASGTTVAYFWQLSGGHSIPSWKLAKRIETASGGKIKASALRPDIFG